VNIATRNALDHLLNASWCLLKRFHKHGSRFWQRRIHLSRVIWELFYLRAQKCVFSPGLRRDLKAIRRSLARALAAAAGFQNHRQPGRAKDAGMGSQLGGLDFSGAMLHLLFFPGAEHNRALG
jgi:hypothetical protein